MAELGNGGPGSTGTPNARSRGQAGQVFLDALIASLLIGGAALIVGRGAQSAVERAEMRHREVLIAIEAENALARGFAAQPAE